MVVYDDMFLGSPESTYDKETLELTAMEGRPVILEDAEAEVVVRRRPSKNFANGFGDISDTEILVAGIGNPKDGTTHGAGIRPVHHAFWEI